MKMSKISCDKCRKVKKTLMFFDIFKDFKVQNGSQAVWLAGWLIGVASWLAELAPGGWAPRQHRGDSN